MVARLGAARFGLGLASAAAAMGILLSRSGMAPGGGV